MMLHQAQRCIGASFPILCAPVASMFQASSVIETIGLHSASQRRFSSPSPTQTQPSEQKAQEQQSDHAQPEKQEKQDEKPKGYSIAAHMMDASSKAPLMSVQYPSSGDDPFGVQKNWFDALYKQLNYMAKTGNVPELKEKQRMVFEQVEKEFEGLYNKWIKDKEYSQDNHRSMLMCCLSIATYRGLNEHIEDTRIVRDVIRTNLGSVMLGLLKPLHRMKLWIYSWLLREDMYDEALKFLPAIQRDMGELCASTVTADDTPSPSSSSSEATAVGADSTASSPPSTSGHADSTYLTVSDCKYHEVLSQEGTPFLLSEFCCHHALMWLHEFRRHGVVVSMDQCKAWDDSCCKIRLARQAASKQ